MFTQMVFDKEIYDEEYEKANSKKNAISTNSEDWKDCNINDLKVGDIIYVDYFPDSQKYIYTYYPEYGTVQEIYDECYESSSNGNIRKELSIKILNHNGELVNINKDNLSIYSRGYFMTIKKFELNNSTTHFRSSCVTDDCISEDECISENDSSAENYLSEDDYTSE